MANIKVTKKDYFSAIIANLKEGKELAYPVEDVLNFLENEVDLLNRKANRSSTKPTKNQVENEGLKATILTVLATAEKPITISEMMQFPELAGNSNQKLSALTKQLVEAGKVVKTVEKKKSLFSLADSAEPPAVEEN